MFLLFHFLEDHAFTEGGVVLEDFNFPLHFLAVLAAPIGIVRLRRLEFDELVLRHNFVRPKALSAESTTPSDKDATDAASDTPDILPKNTTIYGSIFRKVLCDERVCNTRIRFF